jgi:hypothetical protein
MRLLFLSMMFLGLAPACRDPAPPTPAPSAPSASPIRTQVQFGGRTVWPPQGPGCDRLVRCCDAAASSAGFIRLACQLSVAKRPLDCGKSLTTVTNILKEKGLALPAPCSP